MLDLTPIFDKDGNLIEVRGSDEPTDEELEQIAEDELMEVIKSA